MLDEAWFLSGRDDAHLDLEKNICSMSKDIGNSRIRYDHKSDSSIL